MKTAIKFSLVLLVAACGLAQNNDNADYWQDLYDSQWYDEEIEKLGLDSIELDNSKDNNGQQLNIENDAEELGQDEKDADENASDFDESVQIDKSNEMDLADDVSNQDIDGFIPQEEKQPETNDSQNENGNDNDYVLEDNRSISEGKMDLEEDLMDKEPKDLDKDLVDAKENSKEDNIDDYVIEDSRLLFKDDIENFDELPDVKEENVDLESKIDPIPISQEHNNEELNNDEKLVLNSDISEVDMDKDQSLADLQFDTDIQLENGQESQKELEETKQLLENVSSNFGNSGGDSLGESNEDLDYDLKKLFETFDKLSQDDQDQNKTLLFETDKPEEVHNEVADYEEKFGRPFNEAAILKLREDYEESLNNPEYWDDYQSSNENQQKAENVSQNVQENDIDIDEILKKLDEELEQDADDDIVRDQKSYENDALQANEESHNINKSLEKAIPNNSDSSEDSDDADKLLENHASIQANIVEKLTSAELESKIDELKNTYRDELDVNADGFDRNVAPVYITLKVDEAVEITSPDYPNFYPTNNIIDWIFEGDGMGVELNITDLSLNGFMGDYLLIKPGGIDYTGQDGLVFSFHLNSERRYRFLDVSRMFVRFRAHPGMQFARGFKFSVKLVGSKFTLPEPITTPTPAPELPEETLTVFFEGLVAEEFRNRSEEFRSIVADMATLYINRNGIDPGYESTINVTQITRVVECNIDWPGHEPCAAVTFGIPLDYSADQDYRLTTNELEYMWFSYSYIDPFAARLRRMGISAFAIPNEGTVIMVWLVIFLGVLISALMLGFAIWRWNCFGGYSRMPLYNDRDSIISDKRKDDLYPTPHQNLPPLYSDGHFEDRWAGNTKYENTSKVDLGGYSNTNYMDDNELAYIDSDDDVIMSLPGQGNGSRNDGYTMTSKHVFEV